MSIYQRIQELAKSRKISIRQVELDLKFSNGTIRKWKSSAPTQRLTKVADYFNVTVDYLLTGNKTDAPVHKPKIDLADDNAIAFYEGKQVSDEDMEIIRRLLRGK
jgi:transcriptional regulator with XRE-family HTH domain